MAFLSDAVSLGSNQMPVNTSTYMDHSQKDPMAYIITI